VSAGEFQNASEVVREGLRLLERERRREEAKLTALRAAVQVAIDQSERGEGITVERHELRAFIHRLGDEAAQRVKARQ
jgi:antitoxin ParD1/3/4